ncbi:MAG: helix-turn-helix transcriptional regulator [Chloroflexi bacterium]|nr:helix-turn-helix transcriptional regulator [Chloroflexota bacterium]
MGVKRQVARPVGHGFPPDFPERLERFREAAGLSWRALARLLGVTTYRLSLWRRGTVPSGAHLFLLLTLAAAMGLRDGILMCPERDLPRASASRRD